MSHLRERKEKNCLNCNAEVQGRYCHVCGQENIETRETVWHLVSHFFQDITHFDGKFFSTLKYLVLKPGFVSMEYMTGRRASYVNPVRMYIFTSAFFFLIFFSLFKMNTNEVVRNITINNKTPEEIAKMDSTEFADFTKGVNLDLDRPGVPMTREEFNRYVDSTKMKIGFFFTTSEYKTRAKYDSALASGKIHHNWFQRQMKYKEIELNERAAKNPDQVFGNFMQTLLHSLPQMFFISLPVFALLLHLLYIRQKKYYYVNHGIFSIHFYIFSFIAMLIMFGLGKINAGLGWGLVKYIEIIIFLGILFYLYKAMRRFYQQRRVKTILKFLALCFSFLLFITFLFIVFVLFSLFKI